MQWFQNTNQNNVDNLNNIRREDRRHFGTKRSNICNIKKMTLKLTDQKYQSLVQRHEWFKLLTPKLFS